MIITKKDDTPKISTTINGTNIEQVTNFQYLGQKITEGGNVKILKKRGESALLKQLSKMSVLKSRKTALTLKVLVTAIDALGHF